jgi:hypothetical protein
MLIEDDARNIAAVSKALGHSSMSITLDIYGKTSRVESQAITRMGELLFPNRDITGTAEKAEPDVFVMSKSRFMNAG